MDGVLSFCVCVFFFLQCQLISVTSRGSDFEARLSESELPTWLMMSAVGLVGGYDKWWQGYSIIQNIRQ